jgi:hypothetical protein
MGNAEADPSLLCRSTGREHAPATGCVRQTSRKFSRGLGTAHGMLSYGLHAGERVLDAVVELVDQQLLRSFCLLALEIVGGSASRSC